MIEQIPSFPDFFQSVFHHDSKYQQQTDQVMRNQWPYDRLHDNDRK